MESFKKILNILVMVYLLVAFLFLLRILSVSKFVALFDLANDAVFFNRMLWAGAVLLLAELLVENAYIATLKRGLEREHRQITELKAQLYDQKLKTAAATAPAAPDTYGHRNAPVHPTPPPRTGTVTQHPDADQGPIITPAPIPPTLNPDENPNLPPSDHRPLQ